MQTWRDKVHIGRFGGPPRVSPGPGHDAPPVPLFAKLTSRLVVDTTGKPMPPTTTDVILLASRPEAEPTPDNFELVERPIEEPGHGAVLVRIIYLSINSYMGGRMKDTEAIGVLDPWPLGEPLKARAVGEVVQSSHDEFEPGDIVTGSHATPMEWAEYCVMEGADLERVDTDLAPISTAIGVLGISGQTAYFGMLDVARPRPGETVVVSAAAGSVGSVAGQIARLNGCHVVGIAGADEKLDYIRNELGYDSGINYRTADVVDALSTACPDGVDVYFDNVGGEISDAVIGEMNDRGRIAVCGQISQYNKTGETVGPRHLWTYLRKQIRVEGFLRSQFDHRYDEAKSRLAEWLNEGKLSYRETVTEGLENAPDALIGLYEGENIGKQLVQVGDTPGGIE